MSELQNLKRLHEAQDTILSLRCKIAGLKGKCMSIIKWHELYEPEEVKLAEEMQDELDEILSPNRIKELLK
jgi:hypothetical protein